MHLRSRCIVALASAALLGAAALVAQKPTPKRPPAAARADTTTRPSDTTAAPKDSLTRFLESFSFRNLGPAAYSGRVTALAVPRTGGYSKTFYIGAAGGGGGEKCNGGVPRPTLPGRMGRRQPVGPGPGAPPPDNRGG